MNPGVKFSELASIENHSTYSKDFEITQLCTDTRTIQRGDTYIAIKGNKFDGHDFIHSALSSGASSLVVSRDVNDCVPSIKVQDTVVSLGNIAKIYRNKLPAKVVGITGSNGKTAVKDMVGSICAECGNTTATISNNNNLIGVPKTLLSALPSDQFLVVEMGTSEIGEISRLSYIVDPDVSVITNISESHLSGIGTKDDVFKEKSAIIKGTRSDGVIVINLDDEFSTTAKKVAAEHSLLTYGFSSLADVSGTYEYTDARSMVSVMSPVGQLTYSLHAPGRHSVANSFAAVAIACALNISVEFIIRGLEQYSVANGRLQATYLRNKIILFDDTYNANPASCNVALEVISAYPGRKVFVFAGMAELGERAPALHEYVGKKALDLHIDALFVLGDITLPTFDVFNGEKYHFHSVDDLTDALFDFIKSGDVILIKASRCYKMEYLSRLLQERFG